MKCNATNIRIRKVSCLDSQYFKVYKVEEDEVDGTCGTNGREEERV
jgi:hypothetical protein